eukprot:1140261-Pelagomonas_calceolata.AAC.2
MEEKQKAFVTYLPTARCFHKLLRSITCLRLSGHNFRVDTQQHHGNRCSYELREFVVDLRKRLRGVWNADPLAEHGEHMNK